MNNILKDKKALIVGGGPAGCTTALFLAKRGMQVKIVEQRPLEMLDPNFKSSRNYYMALSSRSWKTLEQLDLLNRCDAVYPFKRAYQNGVPGMAAVSEEEMNANPALRAYSADRMAFGWNLISHLKDQPSISWSDGLKLETVDFDGKKATFSSSTTKESVTESYDLLLGCDGLNSKVRDELEREELIQVKTIYDAPARYKCFSGLDIQTPGADKVGIDKDSKPFETLCFLRQAGKPLIMTFWVKAGGVSGIITHWDDWSNGEALRDAITTHHPLVPSAWAQSIVNQVTANDSPKEASFGRVVKVSQLHGPSTILVGDAGHAVTSGLGQGLNSALESVRILDNVLSQGMSLELVPVAFNALRLRDAHALQRLERWTAILMNSSLKGNEGSASVKIGPIDRLLAFAILTPAITLSFLLPKIFKSIIAAPHFLLLRDSRVSYSTILTLIWATSSIIWALALFAVKAALSFLAKALMIT